jgi:hypothetical protein
MNKSSKRIYDFTTLLLLLFGILSLIALIISPPRLTVVIIAILLIVGISISYKNSYYFAIILMSGFLFRILLILIDSAINILPTAPISSGHSARAVAISGNWLAGNIFYTPKPVTSMLGFVAYLISPFYVVVGSSQMAGRVGIAVISLITGYFIFKLAIRITDRRTALLSCGLVLFWPTIVFRSVIIQREIISVVALLAFLWAATEWFNIISRNSIIVAITSAVIVYIIRIENVILLVAILGIIFAIKSRRRPLYLGLIAMIVISVGAYIGFNFYTFTGYGSTLSPEVIDTFAHFRAKGGAAYLTWLHYESWLDIILYLPLKIVYYLFTPFPWQIRTPVEFVVGVTAIGLFAATVLSRRGIALLVDEHTKYLLVLLSYVIFGVTAYAIFEMNYAAAVRRRIQFIPIIILLAVVGLSRLRIKVRGIE